MGKRRDLRGIAGNLVASFVSRNNDLDGYWALGLLKAAVHEHGSDTVSLDLLEGNAIPGVAPAVAVAGSYRRWLRQELARHELSIDTVREATIRVGFGQVEGSPPPPQTTRGEPFVCRIWITDDRGKTYQRSASAWCAPHDPVQEQRRNPDKRGLTVRI